MLKVSVLVPAYRPTYLRQALASILTQEGAKLDIVVSDDSGGREVREVVKCFQDPRIRYRRTAGQTGAVANCAALWAAARHDLVKYVFDDDVLMPHALTALVAEAERIPAASLWFGVRHIIDAGGRIIHELPPRAPSTLTLVQGEFGDGMLSRLQNPVGEFTSVLMNRAVGLSAADFTHHEGFEMRVLGEIGFYLAAARHAPLIGTTRVVAGFRRHPNQQSARENNPQFGFGVAEWELFLRGERGAGRLGRTAAASGVDRLTRGYDTHCRQFPALAVLQEGLPELRRRVAEEADGASLLDDVFRARWKRLHGRDDGGPPSTYRVLAAADAARKAGQAAARKRNSRSSAVSPITSAPLRSWKPITFALPFRTSKCDRAKPSASKPTSYMAVAV